MGSERQMPSGPPAPAPSRYNAAGCSQEETVSELIIRPTMKFIYAGYAVALLIVAAAVAATLRVQWPPWIPSSWQPWLPWLPALLLLWPLKRHL